MNNSNILLIILNLAMTYLLWTQTITPLIIKTKSLYTLISFYYILHGLVFNIIFIILYYSQDICIIKLAEEKLSNMTIINIFNFSLLLFNYAYVYIKYNYYHIDLNTNYNEINYIMENNKKNTLNFKRLSDECINDIYQIMNNCDDRQKRLLIRTVNKYLN